jgi:hypothetical protein
MIYLFLWFLIGYVTTIACLYRLLKESGKVTINDVGIASVAGIFGPLLTLAVCVFLASKFFEVHGEKVVLRKPDENEGG